MPTTLVVVVHPEPTSFTCAWAKASIDAARGLGHDVLVSDLYAQGFDPAERGEHYGIGAGFDPLKAQEQAAASGTLPSGISEEVDKVEAADLVIFHFPIWWFAPPAMLKGWCERALVHGRLHAVDARFDSGPCRGKRALFCVSTGAKAAEIGPDGKEGRLDYLLWPLAYTLRYCGFDVLAPVSCNGVHGYWTGADKAALDSRLGATLDAQRTLLEGIGTHPLWRFNADTDFDAEGRLKPGAPRLWPFIGGDAAGGLP